MAERLERVTEYQLLAERFRGLAVASQFPEIRAELLWLAQSYQRLAEAPGLMRVADGHRVLEAVDGTANRHADG